MVACEKSGGVDESELLLFFGFLFFFVELLCEIEGSG